jgi:hypothetical protein
MGERGMAPGGGQHFTEEKGATVIAALRAGRRPGSVAQLVNACRGTLYNWKRENEEFSAAWDDAVASATDRIEEVVYNLGLGGDLQAAQYWLKHNRPHPYDRNTLLKLGILQASLAAAQASGNGRLVIDLGQDGLPLLPPPGHSGDPLRNGEPMDPITVVELPHNARDDPPPPPADDGSGRTYPWPKSVRAIMAGGICVQLFADGVEVPSGAIPLLWRRIQAFNALARTSQPPGSSLEKRIAELRQRMQAEAETAGDPMPPTLEALEDC